MTRPTPCRFSSRSRHRPGRKVARGALYTALDRLEAKGCLRSRLGEPLPERGGRARRYFTVTPAAVRALKESRLALMRLWDGTRVALMTPPAVPSWIVRRALPRDDEREMVLGDLQEQLPEAGPRLVLAARPLAIAAHALTRRVRSTTRQHGAGDSFMSTWLTDIRYAWRGLRKRPLLTATITMTLALGLGANAAIFNLIDRMVLRPYPLVDPDRAVLLAETGPRLDFRRESVSLANFLDWRTSAGTITHLAAIEWWDANLVDRGDPERLAGFKVSADFFEAIGVRPALGRGFVRDDETFGRHHVVVISDALWKRRFDGDPGIVGRRILVDGEPHQIVGVAPPRFVFPDGSQIWAPISFDPKTPPRRDSAVADRDRTPDRRSVARGRTGPDGRARRSAGARLSRRQPRSRRPRLYADAGDARRRHRARCCRCGRCPPRSSCSSPAPTSPT